MMPKLVSVEGLAFLRSVPEDSDAEWLVGGMGVLEIWRSERSHPGRLGARWRWHGNTLRTSLSYDMTDDDRLVSLSKPDGDGIRRYKFELANRVMYSFTHDGDPECCGASAADLSGTECYHCLGTIDGWGIILDSPDGDTYLLHRECAYDGCAGYDRATIDRLLGAGR